MEASRWMALVGAMLYQACDGLTYTFALYSEHIRQTLHLSMERTDGIGAAKDFGSMAGFVAGVFYLWCPEWLTILIGAISHVIGYGALWMTLSGIMALPYWLLCVMVAIGVGGDSYIDTVCITTGIQNFSSYGGMAMGVLKAEVGVSGAFFTMLYAVFLAPNANSYLLLITLLPFAIFIVMMPFVKHVPLKTPEEDAPQEVLPRFLFAYVLVISTALYLLVNFIIQDRIHVGRTSNRIIAAIMIGLMTMTLFIPFSKGLVLRVTGTLFAGSNRATSLTIKRKSSSQIMGENDADDAYPNNEDSVQLLAMPTMDSLKPASRYTNEEVEWHRLAELSTSNRPDMTVCQTLWTVDFWLIFIVMATGASTAIAAINNLSQIGRALHVNDVKFFVGLVSIWSCFGRLTGGFLPDILLKKGVPRPVSLCFSTGMISITHLVLKSGAIRLGSVMIGFCYGSYWSITPPITSEIFGLTHFAATYKTVTTFGTISTYIWSSMVAGRLYDRELDRLELLHGPTVRVREGEPTCYGPACFGTALTIFSIASAVGAVAAAVLAWRCHNQYRRKEAQRRQLAQAVHLEDLEFVS